MARKSVPIIPTEWRYLEPKTSANFTSIITCEMKEVSKTYRDDYEIDNAKNDG